MRPYPIVGDALPGRVPEAILSPTSDEVNVGSWEQTSAASPLTIAAENEVPLPEA